MYMKNIFKITIIACFVLSAFPIFSQETQDTQETQKMQKSPETIDLGFGIVQDKKTSTVSMATVKSDVLQQKAAINLQDALYGRLLGLTALQNSGTGWVGDQWFGATFNIRGIQTLNVDNYGNLNSGENGILILVDGFPRSIDRLTLDEIESVTVLKDAAAIALYGYTGINGILSVKTKRGPATGGMKIDVKYRHKFTFLPPMVEYADAYTYAQAMNEARRNDGLGQSYNQFELDAYKSGTYPKLYPDVDWRKESLRNVAAENVLNMTFANRNERMGFFTLLNYTNSQGLLDGTEVNKAAFGYSTQLKYSKINVRTNLDVTLSPSTKLQANLLGSLFETNRPSGMTAENLFRTMTYLPAGVFPINTQDGLWGGSASFNNWGMYNPVAQIKSSGYYREIGVVLNADFKLTQSLEELLKGLSLTGRFSYDAYNIAFEDRNKTYSWAKDRFGFDATGQPIVTNREVAFSTMTQLQFNRGNLNQSRSLNFVLSADYKKQMDEHNLAASLIYNYSNPVTRKLGNETGMLKTFYRANIMGYLHYDFASKYIADVVLTYTGSNRSYPKSWVFSPTASVGWLLSEESFLKGNEFVNLLKLRGSIGILHTDNVPRNGAIWMSIYDPYWGSGGGNYMLTNPDGGISEYGGRTQITLPTANFKLETANKANIGLEAQLMNSLGLTLDAYYQRRSNILMYESGLYSAMAGIGAGYGNLGTVDSKGLEVGLNYDKQFSDWKVNLGGMFTYGVNKIISCVQEPKAYPWLKWTGYAVDQPRGLQFLGFFNNALDMDLNPKQEFSLVQLGDARYQRQEKVEGEKNINSNDWVPIGYSTTLPQINYAFSAGLEFKRLGANILLQGASRFNRWDDQLKGQIGYMPLVQSRNIPIEYYENRWVPGLDNRMAKYPALSSSDRPNNTQQSTLWLRDASFLKLRNVEVYYRFPETMLKKIRLSGLKLSVTGENLYTWTPYVGQDPERSGFTYPTLRGLSAGVSANF